MRTRELAIGALVVGVLDIAFAISFWWIRAKVPPIRIFQSVAAGVLGRADARAGGVPTALLGGVLHFFIAACMVGAYYLLSGPVPMLRRQPVLWGAIYGTAAFFVMNCIVIPLSAAPTPKLDFSSSWLWLAIVAHAALVGVPAAVFAARARR